ncbi:MAG TPA: Rieske (2Fe-2S) protein [Terriglobales bacterium]|nr:Rieske (2Fe-2S) protein [Terriglobales bacterium]
MPIPEERPVPLPPPRDPHGPPFGERRRFLTILSQIFLALWGLGAAAVLAAYLKAPEKRGRETETMVSAGLLDAYRVGEGRLVRHGIAPFFVVRLDAARVVALSAVCTHVRCILGYDAGRRALVCPCHDGRFDLTGNVISGPPPRPLPSYPVTIRAGEIFVRV